MDKKFSTEVPNSSDAPSSEAISRIRDETSGIKNPYEDTESQKQLLSYLHAVENFVAASVPEHIAEQTAAFYSKVRELICLADNYIHYLESHQAELSAKEFQLIGRMSQSSLLLNIKVFKDTEYAPIMKAFRQNHSDFEQFNNPDTDQEVWKGIKAVLYGTEYNDSREQFRESIFTKAQDMMKRGKFDPSRLEHLERFLDLSPAHLPSGQEVVNPRKPLSFNDLKVEYVRGHLDHAYVSRWASSGFPEFKAYLLELADGSAIKFSENPALKKLEEEMASIKQEQLRAVFGNKLSFIERPKKIKLIRDFRFGRITSEVLRQGM